METLQSTNVRHPEAHISINKNRLKTYGNKIFLNDKQNFQIELFNPTFDSVLAEIKINKKNIGAAGVVLRPGEHVYIERFLDEPRLFQFNTYSVNLNDTNVSKIIENNGLVEITFFRELIEFQNYKININDSSCWGSPVENFYTNYSSNEKSLSFFSNTSMNIETGRVEKGEKSNQEFSSINMNWEYLSLNDIKFHLVPSSLKPTHIQNIRRYCDNCGSRIKNKKAKFCFNCGNKL
jgi:hypothetical protein